MDTMNFLASLKVNQLHPLHRSILALTATSNHTLQVSLLRLLKELPLCAMFSVSSRQQEAKACEVYQWWSQPQGLLLIEFVSSLGKISPSLGEISIEDIQLPECGPVENINPVHSVTDRFMDTNNHLLFRFPYSPITDLCDRREIKGLSPRLVGNLLLKRIFPENFETADLNNKLTGLDYLSNVESARRVALRGAAQRLNISEENWREVLADNDQARGWIQHILKQERQVELHYSGVWIGLRIWSMVKEIQNEPFYKPTAIAMLNTLFPPAIGEPPYRRITDQVMWSNRSLFHQYINSVQEGGKTEIDPLVKKLNHPGSWRSWSLIRQNIKEYIELADSMIKGAEVVYGVSFFDHQDGDAEVSTSRHASTATTTSTFSDGVTGETSIASNEQKIPAPMVETKPKFIPIPRSRISGRHIYDARNVSALNVSSEAASKDTASPPWRSDPPHLSSSSVQGNINKDSDSIRVRRTATPRTGTPSQENPEHDRRLPSTTTHPSQEIRNILSGTPEPLDPPPTFGKRLAAKTSLIFNRSRGPDDHELPVQSSEPLSHTALPKKSNPDLLGRKKRPNVPSPTDQFEETGPYGATESEGKNRHDNTSSSLAVPPTLKTKSSFGFLRRRKSRDDARAVSESDSDRTVINATAPTNVKLKSKSSLSSLFARRQARMSVLSYVGADHETPGQDAGENDDNRTIRKARSYGSVKSSSLPISSGRDRNILKSASSADFDEDRIFTSSDIVDPYPFAGFTNPDKRASGERNLAPQPGKLEYFDFTEEERNILLEEARMERVREAGQGSEFLRSSRMAEQKRSEERAKVDPSAQKTPNKIIGLFRKTKDAPTPSKPGRDSTTPDPKTPGSGKDKMTVGRWLAREMSTSYSPQSNIGDLKIIGDL